MVSGPTIDSSFGESMVGWEQRHGAEDHATAWARRHASAAQLRRIHLWRSSRNTPPRRLSEYRKMSLRTEAVDGGRTHHGQKSEVRFRGGLLQRRWPAGAGLQGST